MVTLLLFLIKAFISSLVLTVYYWLLLRNKSFHQFNRFYLLVSLLLSLVIPLLPFNWMAPGITGYNTIDRLISTASGSAWAMLPVIITIVISCFHLTLLFVKIRTLYLIKFTHPSKKMNGFNLVETQLKQAPFSFLNNLFWRTDIPFDNEMGKKIYLHELSHIKEKHSYDKLFSQLLACIFWMNPFYWIIQKELNMVHEFIADEHAVERGDTETFAGMLLQSYNQGTHLTPAHSFFHSPVKRRLNMIASYGYVRWSSIRRLSVLPVVVLAVILCSFSFNQLQIDFLKKQGEEKLAAEKADLSSRHRNIGQ